MRTSSIGKHSIYAQTKNSSAESLLRNHREYTEVKQSSVQHAKFTLHYLNKEHIYIIYTLNPRRAIHKIYWTWVFFFLLFSANTCGSKNNNN